MKNAVIVTMSHYPNGDAGAVRSHAIAKLLSKAKYNVTVIAYGKYNGQKMGSFDGIKYTSLRKKGTSFFSKAHSRLTHHTRLARYVKKNFPKVDLFLADYVPLKTFAKIERLAAYYGAKIYHDSCEWYSPEEFFDGEKNRGYIYVNRLNTEIIRAPWRVISISKYLDGHFRGRGVKSVRVPVIMDIPSMKYSIPENSEKTVLVYAGSPGKKDYLSSMIEGFASLDKEQRERLEFHILGVSAEVLVSVCGVKAEHIAIAGDSLVVHGRVKREEALAWVRRADFTVLLRDGSLRYTKAGFPTKVVESLASATPVICNITSDLGDYLSDGENAIITPTCSPSDFARALLRAAALSCEEKRAMSESARKCAEDNFDYREYSHIFDEDEK